MHFLAIYTKEALGQGLIAAACLFLIIHGVSSTIGLTSEIFMRRLGSKWTYFIGLVGFAGFMVTVAMSTTLTTVLVIAPFMGYGLALHWTGAQGFIMESSPADKRGLTSGTATFAQVLAPAITATPLGFLAEEFGFETMGWAALFLVVTAVAVSAIGMQSTSKSDQVKEAHTCEDARAKQKSPLRRTKISLPTLVKPLFAFISVLMLVKLISHITTQLSDKTSPKTQQGQHLKHDVQDLQTPTDKTQSLQPLSIRSKPVLWVLIIRGAGSAMLGVFVLLSGLKLTQAGGGLSSVGFFVSGTAIGGALAQLLMGRLSDYFGRRWLLGFTMLCGIGSSIVFGATPNLYVLIGASAFHGLFRNASQTLLVAITGDMLRGGDTSRISAFMTSAFSFGMVVGMLIALSYEWDQNLPFYLVSAVTACALPGLWTIPSKRSS